LITKKGRLSNETKSFHIPRPKNGKEDDGKGGGEAFNWEKREVDWWWVVADVDDFDNLGMSRAVESPGGVLQIVLCSECGGGPLGFKMEGENELYLCCEELLQQDASAADNETDFKLPEGTSMEQLRQMMNAGSLTVQFEVVFTIDQPRLGMQLR